MHTISFCVDNTPVDGHLKVRGSTTIVEDGTSNVAVGIRVTVGYTVDIIGDGRVILVPWKDTSGLVF